MEELEVLKTCENDDDYTLMLRQLCNDGYTPSGPYPENPEDCDWQRANSKRVVHKPPSDEGQYD